MNTLILPKCAFDVATATAVITNPAKLAHIKTVLQADVGDTLKIAKLGGQMGMGQIYQMDNTGCYLTKVVLAQAPPPKLGVTVVLALPRPKVVRRLILDMTAVGVAHIILVNSARTDKSYWQSPILDRLDEFILEGLEQGMDSIPPKLTLAKRFKPFVQDDMPSLIKDKTAFVFHPYADVSFGDFVRQGFLPDILVIGAEGGFVPYEIELLKSIGVQAVTLGKRILRTESALNAVLGWWLG